jgi:WD40 repeat protein
MQPTPEVNIEWRVGDVILDLYEVKQVHEGGGMGLVYRVHHRGWNMDLAVKSPRPEYFQTHAQKENFARECETWIKLGLHPHIVSCHYVRTLGGIPRVFAEYVEGGSVKEWIDSRRLYEGGPQEALKRILDIAIQMAWGLDFAHEQGLIHQDVKPANVLMQTDGRAKVTDFGLAKARATTAESQEADQRRSILVSTGGMTPAYCSPEQANKQPLTRRSDIWSWAVSVLEMFVGGVWWQSGVAAPEVLRHLAKVPTDEGALLQMPTTVEHLLVKCFEVEQQKRPRSFLAVIQELRHVCRNAIGQEYEREQPEAAVLLADGLNNRAVSLLDLGKTKEAELLLSEASRQHPGHLQATYNLGLLHWRTGRGTDADILPGLREIQRNRPQDWTALHLEGLVHLERGDAEGAARALQEAIRLGGDTEVKRALVQLGSMPQESAGCLRSFEGHIHSVNSVALSVDRRWALSGSSDGTLRLWQLAIGQCTQIFKGHTHEVTACALSADGRWALSGSHDRTVRLWDATNGHCERRFEGHARTVTSVALTADERHVLSGSVDGTMRLWETASGRCIHTLKELGGAYLQSIGLSRDARWVVTGCAFGAIRLWEIATGNLLQSFEAGSGVVKSVVLSADDRWVLSGSSDKMMRLWEVSTGRCVRVFKGHTGAVTSVALSTDGRCLSGSNDNTVRLWEVATGCCLRTFEGHAFAVCSVAMSADGRWALSGSADMTLRLWNCEAVVSYRSRALAPPSICRVVVAGEAQQAGRRFARLLQLAQEACRSASYAEAFRLVGEARSLPGYEHAAAAVEVCHEAGLRGRRVALRGIWCTRSFEGHSRDVESVAFARDGKWVMSGSLDRTLRLWELATGRCIRTFEGHTAEVLSIALSADERWALSGSSEGSITGSEGPIRLWDVATGHCVRTFKGHESTVDAVALSPDRLWAVSGSSDGTLRLWEVGTGRCVRTFERSVKDVSSVTWSEDGRKPESVPPHLAKIVRSVALSADGRLLLSGRLDNTLRLWELATGRCVRTFEGHTAGVFAVAWSADARWALSGSWDKTLRLWEIATGRCVRILQSCDARVTAVALSADGRWAVSGSKDDSALRLWEVSTGRCVRMCDGHTMQVTAVAWSMDGQRVISGSADRTLRLWELEWECDFPDPQDWAEEARPCLEIFLTLHCPVAEDGFTRIGRPAWTEDDFRKLLADLKFRGYGWLRPEGVSRQLEKMTAEWKGPPPLPGT